MPVKYTNSIFDEDKILGKENDFKNKIIDDNALFKVFNTLEKTTSYYPWFMIRHTFNAKIESLILKGNKKTISFDNYEITKVKTNERK